MLTQEEIFLQAIEKQIRQWLAKNPKLMLNLRYDNINEYTPQVSKRFMEFLKEVPRFRIYLRKIGIIEEGLTTAGYIYLRRIAQTI